MREGRHLINRKRVIGLLLAGALLLTTAAGSFEAFADTDFTDKSAAVDQSAAQSVREEAADQAASQSELTDGTGSLEGIIPPATTGEASGQTDSSENSETIASLSGETPASEAIDPSGDLEPADSSEAEAEIPEAAADLEVTDDGKLPLNADPEPYTGDGYAVGGCSPINNLELLEDMFSGTALIAIDGLTTTITLRTDVKLDSALAFEKGSGGETLIIDLNGHTITAPAGGRNASLSAANGGDAIIIDAAEYDVEIRGPGAVIGGKGGICEEFDEENRIVRRDGADGGNAVFMMCGDLSYDPVRLEHGLTVTGGAQLIGGTGGGTTYEDWLYNIQRQNDLNLGDSRAFEICCGRGGCGITQSFTEGPYYYRDIYAEQDRVYARYVIEDGQVIGGEGGSFDAQNHPYSVYAIRHNDVVNAFIANNAIEDRYFDAWVFQKIHLVRGDGGHGIAYFTGRKYIYVGENALVSGGSGGHIDFGETGGYAYRLQSGNGGHTLNTGKGGCGIYGCGDIGITNVSPSLEASDTSSAAYWGKKTAGSDDMGIYVAGVVTGGNTPDCYARQGMSEYGGDGICLDGDEIYSGTHNYELYNGEWGILMVAPGGLISGGNAGSVPWGTAASGGSGIYEAEKMNYALSFCNYYVIRGQVTGGNGGNCGGGAPDGNTFESDMGVSVTNVGEPGEGGNGIWFRDGRRTSMTIAGDGSVKAGQNGLLTDRESLSDTLRDYYTNYWHTDDIDGLDSSCWPAFMPEESTAHNDGFTIRPNVATGLTASAAMTTFSRYPSDNTALSCAVTLPSDYTGRVYYDWRLTRDHINPTTGKPNYQYDCYSDGRYEYDFGGNGASFTLAEATYTAADFEARMKSDTNIRFAIYCYVMLEDGRCVKSNEIWFTNTSKSSTGWTGGTTPTPTPGPDDPTPTPTPGPDDPSPGVVTRLFGSNRYSTSLAIATQLKKENGGGKFGSIVLARGTEFPDALAGGYLATVKKAPIILIRDNKPVSHKDNQMVAKWIKANLKSGGTIYVLGSTAAVPKSHVDLVKSGFKVKRLEGKNRFGTNAAILEAIGTKGINEIIVTTGRDFPDALCASALDKPLLIVETKKGKEKLDPKQTAYLAKLNNPTFYVVGPTAVVPKTFETQLKTYGTVRRIATDKNAMNRSVQIAETLCPNPGEVALAVNDPYPDGLCGGVIANKHKAPLLLVKKGSEAKAASYVKSKGIKSGLVFGANKDTVVPNASVTKIVPGAKIVNSEYK